MLVTLKVKDEEDRLLNAPEGQNILSFLANQGIHLDAPCAGHGKCGKCLIKAEGALSEPSPNELKTLDPGTNMRLACQAQILGEVTVYIEGAAHFSSVKGLGESEPYDVDSPLKILSLELLDRQDATCIMAARNIKKASIEALNEIGLLDARHETGRAVVWGDELLKAWPEPNLEQPTELLAAALDLGTTGLAAAIIDTVKGEVIAQSTALNPQTASGGDVITRITAASEGPDKLAYLQDLALEGLGKLIIETAGDKADKIMAAVVSGNTTMTYLLGGVHPTGLALSPYRPLVTQSIDLSHLASRLNLNPRAKVLTAPCISAYVGGDITSGILAVGLKQRPGTVLYIDIGTNGEIVLSHEGRLVATSCAAGPALEGMNILCGQRAISGAVDSFAIDGDYNFRYTTIGNAPVTGICGSGLIDIAAGLVSSGMIHKTGKLLIPENKPEKDWFQKISEEGRLYLTDRVFFDQKDIRQIQLAKGAIAAAVEMLLAKVGLTEKNLDEIIIAGAFGFHLKAESLKAISLIPQAYEGPVRFVGNASLAGSARMLLHPRALDDLNALSAETEVLELGFDPNFQTIFMKHLKF